MITAKYKLVRAGRRAIHRSDKSARFYRLQATRDIPEHGVKAGDFGGYVTNKNILSQDGSCWIEGQAQAIGRVSIEDNVYLADKAVVHAADQGWNGYPVFINLSDDVKITGNATVYAKLSKSDSDYYDNEKNISGSVHIFDEAYINTVSTIKDDVKIYGSAVIDHADYIDDHSQIYGNAHIGPDCTIGDAKIFGNSVIQKGATVYASSISGHAVIPEGRNVSCGELDEGILAPSKEFIERYDEEESDEYNEDSKMVALMGDSSILAVPIAEVLSEAIAEMYQEIHENIMSYQNDIVKIIKYPVMTDKTDSYTLKMMVALNAAKRLLKAPGSDEFKSAVQSLEEAFMEAESNARKIAASLLSETDKKKTAKAKDLLAIASNDASTEQEKKVAFVQGFKQLEGVIDVPDIAVDTFRLKIGLQELQA
jgi:carbonic anhydrase/acetyltransferase-like protein (isoleucine patch superfamily)